MSLAAISFVVIPLEASKVSPGAPATVTIVAVALAAFGLYLLLGSPGVKSAETSPPHDDSSFSQASSSTSGSSGSIGTVASLADSLRTRLGNEPDDAGGWLLLAQSYDHLGRRADAVDAYGRAQALGKTDIEFEASLLGKTLANQRPGVQSDE